jgi:hypothetical protein
MIWDVLIELLGHAHDCYECEDDMVDFKIDVMDFIFNEMYNAMIGRNTIPYAPYVMLLIKDTLRGTPGFEDMSDDCEDHKVKKPYMISKSTAAPTSHGSFMGDARRRDPPSAKEAKKASRIMTKEVKKLNWFQKNVLCLNVEIHKENYQGYRERKDIMDTQRQILHKLSGDQGDAPVPRLLLSTRDGATRGLIGVGLDSSCGRSRTLLLQLTMMVIKRKTIVMMMMVEMPRSDHLGACSIASFPFLAF